jgi:hypothetical protein
MPEAIDAQTLAHYREQLASYAELLRRATGQVVARVCIPHLSADSATVLDLDGRAA